MQVEGVKTKQVCETSYKNEMLAIFPIPPVYKAMRLQ